MNTVLFHGQIGTWNSTVQYSAQPNLNIYTWFISSQLITNISGSCYSL